MRTFHSIGIVLVSLHIFSVEGISMLQAEQPSWRVSIGPVWRFYPGEPPGNPFALDYDDSKWDRVSLPHVFELFNANLMGFSDRGRTIGWYRLQIRVSAEWISKKVFLEFEGAMQATTLWVNGTKAGQYAVSGYDSFDFDITPYLKVGRNVLAVEVDNRVNPQIPPDGPDHDYILFGGLYRSVFLHVIDTMHLTFPWESRQAGVRLTLPTVSDKRAVVQSDATVRNESAVPRKCRLVTEIREPGGEVVSEMSDEREIAPHADATFTQKSPPIANPHLWSPEDPNLYDVVTIVRQGDSELDQLHTRLGIRWVKFDKQTGFWLNGRKVKLVGANVHQSWPFIGNAVPAGLHRRDAEQLKAMGINWVRLAHYPYSPDFLDDLDELGLMALEEPPTWMQPGPGKWMDNLEASFRSMVRRDRNHPCIIMWGTCINHQGAEPRLVKAAIEEDPTRDRAQDTVPTPMNFAPRQISGNGALAVEHTGHTFPAARGQREYAHRVLGPQGGRTEKSINREYEQAQRHWEQLNAAYLKPDNAGLAVWCMYDYNTFHNTSEPGMVWHGVCDLFRIPKYSYYWHQSELTTNPMAYVVRIDATNVAVFSNCQQIRLWESDNAAAICNPDADKSLHSASQPTAVGYQSPAVPGTGGQQPISGQPKYKLIAVQKPDFSFTTPEGQEIPFALHHPPFHFKVSPSARALKAEGLIGDTVRATYEWKQPGLPVALTLVADRPKITADGADLSRIIVIAIDTNGTPVDTCTASVTFSIEGLGQLIGENPVKLRAGKMIILAQSAFVPGEMTITASAKSLTSARVTVRTMPVPPNVDMPKDLPAKQPTPRSLYSGGAANYQ